MTRHAIPPTCIDAKFADVSIAEYQCCSCDRRGLPSLHRSGDPLFSSHAVFQAKHSYREVDVYAAIVEANVRAKS